MSVGHETGTLSEFLDPDSVPADEVRPETWRGLLSERKAKEACARTCASAAASAAAAAAAAQGSASAADAAAARACQLHEADERRRAEVKPVRPPKRNLTGSEHLHLGHYGIGQHMAQRLTSELGSENTARTDGRTVPLAVRSIDLHSNPLSEDARPMLDMLAEISNTEVQSLDLAGCGLGKAGRSAKRPPPQGVNPELLERRRRQLEQLR
jgi:hypothetical protein